MNDLKYKDFEILESIRGLASLYVVIGHSRGLLWMGGSVFLNRYPISDWAIDDYFVFGFSMLTRLAVEFVIVFFILSGFSIAHSIKKSLSKKSFYIKRIIRIYPPYIIAIFWALMVALITKFIHPNFYDQSIDEPLFDRYYQSNEIFAIIPLIKTFLYMPISGFIQPFWSLTQEIIFYILAPFLLLKLNFKYYLYFSLIAFFSYLILGEIFELIIIRNALLEYFFIFNFFFAIGIALYQYYGQFLYIFSFINKNTHILISLLLLLIMYAVNIYFQESTVWSYIPSALFSISIITLFLKYEIKIKPLMQIGKFSYTLYITHFATIFLYHSIYYKLFPKTSLPYIENYFVFIPAIFFCLGIAFLQYNLIEKKTKKVLNKLRSKS